MWGVEHSCHYRKKARSKGTKNDCDVELLPTPATEKTLHKLSILYLAVRTVQQEGNSTVPDGNDTEAGR